MTIKCDQCAAVVINGIPCHETGCPNSHIDLATNSPYQVECKFCGTLCDRPVGTTLAFCSEGCICAYWG